jgi:hypothetical protein
MLKNSLFLMMIALSAPAVSQAFQKGIEPGAVYSNENQATCPCLECLKNNPNYHPHCGGAEGVVRSTATSSVVTPVKPTDKAI